MILLPYDMPTYHPHPTHPHWRKVGGGFLDRLVITVDTVEVKDWFSWDQPNGVVRVRQTVATIKHKGKTRIDLYGGTKYVTFRLKGVVGVWKRE